MIVDRYFPPVAGALCILMKIKNRIDFPTEALKIVEHPLLSSEKMENATVKYKELTVSIIFLFLQAITNLQIFINNYIIKNY